MAPRRMLLPAATLLLAFALGAQTPAPATAPAPAPAAKPAGALDTIASDAQKRHALPALIIGVVGRNGLETAGAAGVHGLANEPATADDRVHLGSCTKAFTATLAAALVADGTLRWDSTVGEVLGPSVPTMLPEWKAVTLEELLQHRGGAPAAPPTQAWTAAGACQDSPTECRTAFVETLLTGAPPTGRGTFAYSNQGYAIAGRMLEVAGKGSYEALLEQRVLRPLGIAHAGYGPPSAVDAQALRGHAADGTLNDGDNPAAIAPAGTLHMPVGEWAKFIAFHLGGTPPAELQGAAAQLARLHAVSKDNPTYAMGWLVAARPWGGTVLTHAGSNTLWYCVTWLAPEKGFAVLAATNIGGDAAQRACDEACAAMIKQRVAPPAAAPKSTPAPPAVTPAPPAATPAPPAQPGS